MEVTKTKLDGVLVLEPKLFKDERGFFMESFNAQKFKELTGFVGEFVQDNLSSSRKNVIRGLHYQVHQPQGKLVSVASGRVFDVAVDIRQSSSTFGQWFGIELSEENRRQLWIPAGFAHGFLVLSESATFMYKTTDYWSPQGERSIRWNSPELGINWPFEEQPVVAPKDADAPFFNDAEYFK